MKLKEQTAMKFYQKDFLQEKPQFFRLHNCQSLWVDILIGNTFQPAMDELL